ncbi:MAG: tetratricopeptide repeat protein [Bacteroidota bacterium]
MEMELHDIFDNFIGGKMDAAQHAEFEARLEGDEQFRKEYVRHICMVEGISQYERERLKLFLAGNKTDSNEKKGGPTRSLKILFAIAAVLFLLLIPSFVIYKNIRFPIRIYKQFYYDDPGLPVVMGTSKNHLLDEAMIEYKDKNYTVAQAKLENIASQTPATDTLNYYLGICYLQSNQSEKAISTFIQITNVASPYYYLSKYYTGLAYIKLRDYSQAQDALTEVLKCGDCFIASKAKALIKEL